MQILYKKVKRIIYFNLEICDHLHVEFFANCLLARYDWNFDLVNLTI